MQSSLIEQVRRALDIEAAAVASVARRVDDSYLAAAEIMGRARNVIVTALGKPGYVGMKLAATLASIGVSAHFVHAAESLHGDSGRVGPDDVLVAISNSGSTAEVLRFVGMARSRGCRVVAISGRLDSELARTADVVVDASVIREADPLNLAPTASVMASLAACDALAVALMLTRGTTRREFYESHPGGNLGQILSEESV